MIDDGAAEGVIRDWDPQRSLSGYTVGVLCIDSHYPIIPGNAQDARTFPFPVLHGIVEGVLLPDLLRGDPKLEPLIIAAGKRLRRQGVGAIVGACGSFANYQRAAAVAFGVPTCMSVLTQVPHLLSLMPPQQKLAIYFAAKSAFTQRVRDECGIVTEHMSRLVVAEAWEVDAFRRFAARPSLLDSEGLGAQLSEHASRLRFEHPEIGAVLLQCSDLPPFAHVFHKAMRVPVFDVTLVVEWMHAAARRRLYARPT
jgi:Asp/Glu/hydantoin racemase